MTVPGVRDLCLTETCLDSPYARAEVQVAEDALESLAKWIDMTVKDIRQLIDGTSRTVLDIIPKITVDLQEVGIEGDTNRKQSSTHGLVSLHQRLIQCQPLTVSMLDNLQKTLQTTQTLTDSLIDKLNGHFLLPLAQGLQRDLRDFRGDDRKAHDRALDRYEQAVSRYQSLGKGKDTGTVKEEAFQLYEARLGYMQSALGYLVRIEKIKANLDSQLAERLSTTLRDVAEYFECMAGVFGALLKGPLDDIMDRLRVSQKAAASKASGLDTQKTALIDRWRSFWNPDSGILVPPGGNATYTFIKQGWLFKRRTRGIGTPWKPVWVMLRGTKMILVTSGTSRGSIEEQVLFDLAQVTLVDVRTNDTYDRRWVFEILLQGPQSSSMRTATVDDDAIVGGLSEQQPQAVHIFQACGEDDMRDWIRSLYNARTGGQNQQQTNTGESESLSLERNEIINTEEGENDQGSEDIKGKDSLILPTRVKEWTKDLKILFRTCLEEDPFKPKDTELALFEINALITEPKSGIIIPGQVIITQSALYGHALLFGVEIRTRIPLINIANVLFDNQNLFWSTIIIKLRQPFLDHNLACTESLISYHLLKYPGQNRSTDFSNNEASFNRMCYVIDQCRSVKQYSNNNLQDLLSLLFEEGKQEKHNKEISTSVVPKTVSSTPTIIGCGCEEHLEKQMYNSFLPLPVEQAVDLNFGPDCPIFKAFLPRVNFRNPQIPPWSNGLNSGSVRECRYLVSPNNPLVRAVDILSIDTWTVLRHDQDIRCSIERVASTPGVIYGDTFQVVMRYCFTAVNRNQGKQECKLVISGGLRWLKSTILKPIIRAQAMRIAEESHQVHIKCLEERVGETKTDESESVTRKLSVGKGEERVTRQHTSVSVLPILGEWWIWLVGGAVITLFLAILLINGRPLNSPPECVMWDKSSTMTKFQSKNNIRQITTDDRKILTLARTRAQLLEALAEVDRLEDHLLKLKEKEKETFVY